MKHFLLHDDCVTLSFPQSFHFEFSHLAILRNQLDVRPISWNECFRFVESPTVMSKKQELECYALDSERNGKIESERVQEGIRVTPCAAVVRLLSFLSYSLSLSCFRRFEQWMKVFSSSGSTISSIGMTIWFLCRSLIRLWVRLLQRLAKVLPIFV